MRIIILLFISIIFAQPGISIKKQLNSLIDVRSIASDSGYTCFLNYGVPLSNLIFERENGDFRAGFTIIFEIQNEENGKIIREYQNKSIKRDRIPNIKDNREIIFGSIKTHLVDSDYLINAHILLNNSSRELNYNKFNLSFNKESGNFIDPIIVKTIADEIKVSKLGRLLPFSPESYDIIFLSNNLDLDELKIEIIQSKSLILEKNIKSKWKGSLKFIEKNNQLYLDKNIDPEFNFFLVQGINKNIQEGSFKINLKNISTNELIDSFTIRSFWFDKPKSLINEDHPERLLRSIGEYDNYQNYQSDLPDKEKLFYFWKKFDPTPDTEFNELMNEFYHRADYAINNFSVLNDKDGARTDRGKIYLMYGKPDKTDRKYNNRNDIIEVWKYNKLNVKFIFKDKTGSGNFELVENE